MDPALAAHHHFCQIRASDIKGIAARTRGEFERSDVEQHAWIIAATIKDRHGETIDFLNEADQERVLRWLNREFGQFADKTVRHATRLDADQNDDDHASLSEHLSTQHFDPLYQAFPLGQDPLTQLLNDEEERVQLEAVQQSFSEAAVYETLLIQFGQNMKDLARYLNMQLSKLADRLEQLQTFSKIQPSLFDGTEMVGFDFKPMTLPGRIRRQLESCTFEQLCLHF